MGTTLENIDFATAERRGLLPLPAELVPSIGDDVVWPDRFPEGVVAVVLGNKYQVLGDSSISQRAVNYCVVRPPEVVNAEYPMQTVKLNSKKAPQKVHDLLAHPDSNAPEGFDFLRQSGTLVFYNFGGSEVVFESRPPYDELHCWNATRKQIQAMRKYLGESL